MCHNMQKIRFFHSGYRTRQQYLEILTIINIKGHHTCRNLVAKGSEYLIIVSAALVSLLEHVTGTYFMSNVIFLIILPVCTLIAMRGGGAGI